MNKMSKLLALVLAVVLCLSLAACGNKQGNSKAPVNYSLGLTPDGRFEGVNTADCVTLGQYTGITYPEEVLTVREAVLQEEISSIVSAFATTTQVKDRAVQDGDTVNIDYVGSIDGVEFEGGSTGGTGTTVTIGVTSYIDDFLEQLIGHKPGETVNVEVTFPDPYLNNPDLAGKDALFVTKINYISETEDVELTDEFVVDVLKGTYGYTSVEDMKEKLVLEMRENQISNYLWEQLKKNNTVEVPQALVDNEMEIVIKDLHYAALMYGMTNEDIMFAYYGVDTEEALAEKLTPAMKEQLSLQLMIQAIAEKEGLFANEEDLAAYFKEQMDTEDYSTYVEGYGYGYLYRSATIDKVDKFLLEKNPAPKAGNWEDILVKTAA